MESTGYLGMFWHMLGIISLISIYGIHRYFQNKKSRKIK